MGPFSFCFLPFPSWFELFYVRRRCFVATIAIYLSWNKFQRNNSANIFWDVKVRLNQEYCFLMDVPFIKLSPKDIQLASTHQAVTNRMKFTIIINSSSDILFTIIFITFSSEKPFWIKRKGALMFQHLRRISIILDMCHSVEGPW